MATEFITNSWLMPQNSNQDRVSNYSLTFDGTNDYVIADLDGTGTGSSVFGLQGDLELTVSFWFYRNSTSTRLGVFQWANALSSGAPFLLIQQNSNNLKFFWDGNYRITTTTAQSNWYHVALTRTASDNTIRAYLNGSEVGTYDDSGTPNLQNVATQIYFGNGFQYYFNGKITEVSIFNYALTSANITSIYGTGSAIGNPMSLSTKPIAYYPLGDSAFNGEFLATNNATELFENYSIDIDGVNDYISVDANPLTNFTTSVWFNRDGNGNYDGILGQGTATAQGGILRYVALQADDIYVFLDDWYTVATSLPLNTWVHFCLTYDSTADELKSYIDGSLDTTISSPDFSGASTNAHSFKRIGLRNASTSTSFPGKMSNVSLFNTALSATQITTLYNSGKPFDLNTFAVTPVAWWRLGGVNSSFDGTNWTFLDEIGTNNATSTNMAQSALVDGVGATGNGVSSGMSSGTNRSDAPYSSSNSVSYNMAVTAKSTSVPT